MLKARLRGGACGRWLGRDLWTHNFFIHNSMKLLRGGGNYGAGCSLRKWAIGPSSFSLCFLVLMNEQPSLPHASTVMTGICSQAQ